MPLGGTQDGLVKVTEPPNVASPAERKSRVSESSKKKLDNTICSTTLL